jgi:thioesterase domain-containing protein
LADILSREEWTAPWSALVPIQRHGARPRFFCVHGAGGNVLIFRDLAQNLGPNQPVVGLQSPELSETDVSQARVEELATHYLQEIRATQPEGPYYLGGYSYGGLVAMEMAQQLHAQGERAALLAILDTPGPGFPRNASLLQRLRYHTGIFLSLDPKAKRRYCLARALGIRQRLQSMRRRLARKPHLRTAAPVHPLCEYPDTIQAAHPAHLDQPISYVPRLYPGRITLFRAQERSYYDPTLGWRGVAVGGVDVYEVPGNHDTILQEPKVRILAGLLSALIPEAAAESSEQQRYTQPEEEDHSVSQVAIDEPSHF